MECHWASSFGADRPIYPHCRSRTCNKICSHLARIERHHRLEVHGKNTRHHHHSVAKGLALSVNSSLTSHVAVCMKRFCSSLRNSHSAGERSHHSSSWMEVFPVAPVEEPSPGPRKKRPFASTPGLSALSAWQPYRALTGHPHLATGCNLRG
jgi:hypothetical protein